LALFRGFGFVRGWLCRFSESACLCLAKVLAKIKVHSFSAGILVSVKFPRRGSQFCSAFLFGASPVFSKRFGQHKVFGFWSKEKMRVKSGQVGGVVFSSKGSGQRAGYPTKRAPDVWESARFTSIFLALGFFLLPSIIHARPHAGNANRWHAPCTTKDLKTLSLRDIIGL
jgi:hypothetical protein